MVMEATDTGVGISPELLPHVFEPFFTTKPVGEGTGLGLSIVYAIVEQSGGKVRVASTQVGKGTSFRICVPFRCANESSIPTKKHPHRSTEALSQIILIVEDDPATRKLFDTVLRSDGYRVLSACDGIEGYRTFMEQAGAVNLIATDIHMPRLNGDDMVERIHRTHPSVPSFSFRAIPTGASGAAR